MESRSGFLGSGIRAGSHPAAKLLGCKPLACSLSGRRECTWCELTVFPLPHKGEGSIPQGSYGRTAVNSPMERCAP
jgi:hypothetical protein